MTGSYGYVYDFSVDYKAISNSCEKEQYSINAEIY